MFVGTARGVMIFGEAVCMAAGIAPGCIVGTVAGTAAEAAAGTAVEMLAGTEAVEMPAGILVEMPAGTPPVWSALGTCDSQFAALLTALVATSCDTVALTSAAAESDLRAGVSANSGSLVLRFQPAGLVDFGS